MSLHAQSSPEAQAALAAQKRNSTIASIVVGLLLMTLIALLFWLIGIKMFTDKVEPIVTYTSDEVVEEEVERVKVTNAVKKRPAAPSSAASPVITAAATSPIAIPVPEIAVDAPSPDFGEFSSFGDGFGDTGSGSSFGGAGVGLAQLPSSMKKRCSPEERLARLKEMGGNERCEEAVVKALRWMKKTQNDDGSWTNKNQVAMTGLSILCYLGHCETPLSVEFGETVEKAIVYLIGVSIKNKGKLGTDFKGHAFAYEHAIASYAIAEAYTFCNLIGYEVEGLKEATIAALEVIIKGQNQSGMWDYPYNPSSKTRDLSTSAWAMQALKAGSSTGLDIKGLESAARRGLEGIERNQAANGAYGYRSTNAHGGHYTLTGAGVLCFQQWGKGKTRQARDGIKWLADNSEFKWGTASAEIYGHYYNGQAMMEAGGQEWEDYNELFRDEVLSGQAADGSFTSPGGKAPGNQYNSNLHYRTCLATLMLEVYYRFLPGTSMK